MIWVFFYPAIKNYILIYFIFFGIFLEFLELTLYLDLPIYYIQSDLQKKLWSMGYFHDFNGKFLLTRSILTSVKCSNLLSNMSFNITCLKNIIFISSKKFNSLSHIKIYQVLNGEKKYETLTQSKVGSSQLVTL